MTTILKNLIALVFLSLISINAHADISVQDSCKKFHQSYKVFKNIQNEIQPGSFMFGDKKYTGCKVIFRSKWTLVGGEEELRTILNQLLYPSSKSDLYKAGWRASHHADGADGTDFVITKENVFCSISFFNRSYMNEDWKIITSDDFSVDIQCSKLSELLFDQ